MTVPNATQKTSMLFTREFFVLCFNMLPESSAFALHALIFSHKKASLLPVQQLSFRIPHLALFRPIR